MIQISIFIPVVSALPLSSKYFCFLKSRFQKLSKWNNSHYSWYFHDSSIDFPLFFLEMGSPNKWTKSQPTVISAMMKKCPAWGTLKPCKSQTVHQGAVYLVLGCEQLPSPRALSLSRSPLAAAASCHTPEVAWFSPWWLLTGLGRVGSEERKSQSMELTSPSWCARFLVTWTRQD